MGPGQLDVLGGDDEMLGDGDHVVAPPVGALHHAGLVGSGNRRLPGLGHRRQAQQVRDGEGEFHVGGSVRILVSDLANNL